MAARVSIAYLLIGGLWILLSDRVAAAILKDPAQLTTAQTYKGWFFVAVSAFVLYWYLAIENRRRRSSERDLGSIFEQALEGIFQSTLEGRYLRVNPAMARIYGYDLPEELMLAMGQTGRSIQVEIKMGEQFIQNLLRNGFIKKFEARNYRKDGTVIWTSTTARVIQDEHGQPAHIEGFVTDITSYKVSERALREQEERYRLLFQSAPIGIGVADQQGKILAFNHAILEPGGYSEEDIEQLDSIEQLYADPQERSRLNQMLVHDGRVVSEPVKFKRKDGSQYDTLLTLAPILYNGQQCVQALVEDVTSRRRIEKSLLEEQSRFRVLIENSLDGTALYTRDGNVIYQSPAVKRILGFEPEEVQGLNVAEYVHPEDAARLVEAYDTVLESPCDIVTTEVRTQAPRRNLPMVGTDNQQ